MNISKLLGIYMVCMLLTCGTTALAQSGRPSDHRADGPGRGGPPAVPDSTQIVKIVDDLAQTISLSADQKERVGNLYFAHFREVQVQKSNLSGDREDQREKMEALRKEFAGEVKALLSDQQKVEFEEFQKSHRPERPGQRKK